MHEKIHYEELKELPLRSEKQGDLRNSLVLLGVTGLWHMAQWVSLALPHHTLPTFRNLNGTRKWAISNLMIDLVKRLDLSETSMDWLFDLEK